LDVFVLASFARQVASIAAGASEPVLRVGNLDSVRDFLDIDDVIDAYLELLSPIVAPGVYNVARGVGVRVGDALDALCSLAGIEPRIEIEPKFYRPTDIAVGRASRLQQACGWTARIPFRETLERLLADWRNRISGA
jgi:GDP-4-dehydro-6-deoxy-D-mannose reductase